MPISLPNTTTTDNYPAPGTSIGAQIAGNDVFESGWFTVANNGAFCEFFYGEQGQWNPSPEIYLAPGTYPIAGSNANPLSGIRFRSAVAGKPAQVWGAFFYKNDPVLSSSSEFTSTVSPSGGITPVPLSAPYFRVSRQSPQTIPTGVLTDVSFDTLFDQSNLFWKAANPTQIVIPSDAGAGWYYIQGTAKFNGSAAGAAREIFINEDGGNQYFNFQPPSATINTMFASELAFANVGSILKIQMFQDTGAGLNIGAGSSFFDISIVGFKVASQ